jgi:hypothetical protein
MGLFSWRVSIFMTFVFFLFLLSAIVVTLVFVDKLKQDDVVLNRINQNLMNYVMYSHWILAGIFSVFVISAILTTPTIIYYARNTSKLSMTGLQKK